MSRRGFYTAEPPGKTQTRWFGGPQPAAKRTNESELQEGRYQCWYEHAHDEDGQNQTETGVPPKTRVGEELTRIVRRASVADEGEPR